MSRIARSAESEEKCNTLTAVFRANIGELHRCYGSSNPALAKRAQQAAEAVRAAHDDASNDFHSSAAAEQQEQQEEQARALTESQFQRKQDLLELNDASVSTQNRPAASNGMNDLLAGFDDLSVASSVSANRAHSFQNISTSNAHPSEEHAALVQPPANSQYSPEQLTSMQQPIQRPNLPSPTPQQQEQQQRQQQQQMMGMQQQPPQVPPQQQQQQMIGMNIQQTKSPAALQQMQASMHTQHQLQQLQAQSLQGHSYMQDEPGQAAVGSNYYQQQSEASKQSQEEKQQQHGQGMQQQRQRYKSSGLTDQKPLDSIDAIAFGKK